MNDNRSVLAEVFRDTQAFYTQNPILRKAASKSRENAVFYDENDYPPLIGPANRAGAITVSRRKTFQRAMELHAETPGKKIAVLNFASATNPGGGVKTGASAQEESLCRCSTLYPTLDQTRMWDCYYTVNRAASDSLYTDACIYSPGVVICKSDDTIPQRLSESNFVSVDVITCAAPNLRSLPVVDEQKIEQLHLRRARHILHIAAANGADILILGAFGCGAFCNDPYTVAHAFRKALVDYVKCFDRVDFAVYCREWDKENYTAFVKAFM